MYEKTKGKNEGIQILRAIACAFVVWCHTAVGDGLGAFGVDIFIVICGFMLMYSTRYSTDSFLIKRIKKIVPLYWIMTIVTSILVIIAPELFRSYEFSVVYLIKSILFIPYEHSGILQPIYGLGWTLNYEMMMYIVFWIAMKISYKYRALISSAVLFFVMCISNNTENFYVNYYGTNLVIEFIFGMAAYYFVTSKYGNYVKEVLTNKQLFARFILCVTGMVAFCLLCNVKCPKDMRGYIWGGLALVLFFVFYYLSEIGVHNVKALKWFVEIGNGSYYVYMTHIYVVRGIELIIGKVLHVNMFFVDTVVVVAACLVGYTWSRIVQYRKFSDKCILGAHKE